MTETPRSRCVAGVILFLTVFPALAQAQQPQNDAEYGRRVDRCWFDENGFLHCSSPGSRFNNFTAYRDQANAERRAFERQNIAGMEQTLKDKRYPPDCEQFVSANVAASKAWLRDNDMGPGNMDAAEKLLFRCLCNHKWKGKKSDFSKCENGLPVGSRQWAEWKEDEQWKSQMDEQSAPYRGMFTDDSSKPEPKPKAEPKPSPPPLQDAESAPATVRWGAQAEPSPSPR